MSELDHHRIRRAIDGAERDTTGRIVVRVLARLGRDPVKTAEDQLRQARLHHHPHRNSVVFAVAPRARQFAVYGDEAIHRKLGEQYWKRLVEQMTDRFKRSDATDALVYGIDDIGAQLREHFPKVEKG